MGGAVTALVVLGVLVLIGSPVALSIPNTQPEWTGFAFESAIIGIVVEMFVAIVLLHAGYYSIATALVFTLVIIGGGVFALRRAAVRDGARAPDLSRLRRLAPALIGLATLLLVLAALEIRHAPSYFIFQTGDMGGYVNSANILRRSGTGFGTQPPGFTLFLRETNLLFGKANTVAGLPALGAILLLGVVAFARALKVHVAAALALGFVVVVHPVMVWFSLFPVSEALYATLLIGLLYLLVRARSLSSQPYGMIAGVVAGSLLLVRGEAMLMAPIVVVMLLASAAVDDDATVAVQRRFTVVALVTLFASYAYDVKYTHLYFRAQLRHLLPGFVFPTVERAHLIEFSIPLVLAGALGLALVIGITRLMTRWVRPRLVGHAIAFWRYACGATVGLSLVALAFFRHGGLTDTLARWGPVLIVLVAIGIGAIVAQPGRYVDGACGLLLLLVIGVYTVLFARRVPAPKVQTYFLYFDRYLFSEVLPAALLLAAIVLQVSIDTLARFVASSRVRIAAVAALVVIVVVGVLPQTRETRRETRFRLLGKSYEAVHQLDELTRTHGTGAILYSGSKRQPTSWFYPNTYRAFALPLEQSFNRTVFGIPPRGLGRDVVFDPEKARAIFDRLHLDAGYLVQLRLRGTKKFPDSDHTRYLGTVLYGSPILGQTTEPPAAPWKVAVLRLDVYEIT